jgi:DNA-binding CsgD family transcriptional regulator
MTYFQRFISLNPTSVSKKKSYFFLILFSLVLLFSIVDVYNDVHEGISWPHISHEIGITLFASILIVYQITQIRSKDKSIEFIQNNLEELNNENSKIKVELKKLSGKLHEVIEQQLVQWDLTPSESDISKLILKGLSMKEIAQIRNTSEATVRQQAMNIYKKANVHSRQEFIAFFLEDL